MNIYVGLVGQCNSSGRKIKALYTSYHGYVSKEQLCNEEEVDAVSFNKPNQQQIIINICYNLHLEKDTLKY
jgi:hypothetical protein